VVTDENNDRQVTLIFNKKVVLDELGFEKRSFC